MLTYIYTARDAKTGHEIKAEVEAENEKMAAKLLSDRGLSPIELKVKKEGGSLLPFHSRIPAKEKVVFSRQLSTLVNAGLPLTQSLNTVRDQTPNKSLQSIVGQVISDVEAGGALADSMGRHPRVFDEVYVSLIAAGEVSGTLDQSLERLADHLEKDAEIISKIRGALIYPVIVLVVLGAAVIFMMTAVLPQVQELYSTLPGAELPIFTRLLLGVANILLNFWWLIIILLIAGGFLGGRWVRSPTGRLFMDNFKLHAPGISPLFRRLYMARFSRISATLVASGVPLIKMLETTAKAVNNQYIAESIAKATEQVKGGKALSESLKGDPNFTELVPNMIHIGEQSGSLDNMLGKLADYYEREVDNEIKTISTIIEPLLMVIVGIIALIIVAAILLPIYNLAGKSLIKTY